MEKTNWIVVTGGPSAGKTKTLDHLAYRGYKIIPEAARILIDNKMSEGKTLEEIRSNELAFQKKVLNMKLALEERLPKKQTMFLERGVADSVPYYKLAGGSTSEVWDVSKKYKYKKVFLLAQVPFEKDYARTENAEEANEINAMLLDVYQKLEMEVVPVPLLPIAKRVDYILKNLNLPQYNKQNSGT